MGDLDFAHGIPPERFRCKRSRSKDAKDKFGASVDRFDRICTGRNPDVPDERLKDRDGKPIHWSLDQGRWIFHESHEERRQVEARVQRERNPFIRFKNFVDNGVGALNLVKRQRELNQSRESQEDAAWQRWTGLPSDIRTSTPVDPRSDAIKAARYLLEIADRAVHFDEPSKRRTFNELFRDDQAAVDRRSDPMLGLGAWTFCPEVADSLPSTAGIFRPPPPAAPRWLTIDWFKRSPYSPVQVENIEGMSGPQWREAFEDLMLTTTDRILERTPLTYEQWQPSDRSWYTMAGIDWVFSLQIRGILPPLLPSLHRGRTFEWPGTLYSINSDLFDYKEFSNLADEIWLSHRASRHDMWYTKLLFLRRNFPLHKPLRQQACMA